MLNKKATKGIVGLLTEYIEVILDILDQKIEDWQSQEDGVFDKLKKI